MIKKRDGVLTEPSRIINYNLAIQSNYKLEIPDSEGVNFFLQNCMLPSVSMERY